MQNAVKLLVQASLVRPCMGLKDVLRRPPLQGPSLTLTQKFKSVRAGQALCCFHSYSWKQFTSGGHTAPPVSRCLTPVGLMVLSHVSCVNAVAVLKGPESRDLPTKSPTGR